MKIKLKRSQRNPILEPTDNCWENILVSNAGVIQVAGKIHLIYTAHGTGVSIPQQKVICLGYARFKNIDELEERSLYPVFAHSAMWYESSQVEDPRLNLIGDKIVMTYTGHDGRTAHVCEATISIDDFLAQNWRWSPHRLVLNLGGENKDAAYFPRKIGGKWILLHRPMLMCGENIWLSDRYENHGIFNHRVLMTTRPGYWDDAKIGIAGPPLELSNSWLLIYHGVEASTWMYRLGYVLLDKERPEIVLERSEEPILEPIEDYERFGITPNVVFSCGAVIWKGKLVVYYGAADKVIAVATAKLMSLL